MSKADYQLLDNYLNILINGKDDCKENVRPKWEDGSPAHTIRVFGAVNRYNLQEEFPIASVRKLYWKSAIDEVLWLWQKKSNNIKDLNATVWDQWANKGEHKDQEIGSIGKAYGYQYGKKCIKTKDSTMIDQVDYVLNELKNNPSNRRILTEIYKHEEAHEMNLCPCVHEATFNVNDGQLNMVLNQRSHDTLSAGAWNVVQYAALLSMIAQVTDLKPGEMLHIVADSHCYDKHIPMEFEVILNRCSLIQKRLFESNLNSILANCDEQVTEDFNEIIKILKEKSDLIDFEKEIKIAQDFRKSKNDHYFDYLQYIRKTPEIKAAKTLIERMINSPEIDKKLGFYSPKLLIDKNVTDFYKFESPRMRTGVKLEVVNGNFVREGKFTNNPKSSFEIVDYHPEIEGMEFDETVPVAK